MMEEDTADPVREYQRRFLVRDRSVVEQSVTQQDIRQGYLWIGSRGWELRVRRTHGVDGDGGAGAEQPSFVAVKGPRQGSLRHEYEFEVDALEAVDLLNQSRYRVHKVRYSLATADGYVWSVDRFKGANKGLWIAEVQMQDPARLATLEPPDWAPTDVTRVKRYWNQSLSQRPFRDWPKKKRLKP